MSDSNRPAPQDTIHVHRLRAITRVGVPDAERSQPQQIELCLRLVPEVGFGEAADDISRTVDYYQVAQLALKVAAAGERRLIETLAEEIAAALLDAFALLEVGVEVRKFILSETDYVSVEITRTRTG